MKLKALSWVLAISLISAPFMPAWAGTGVLSDDDLSGFSARGLQVIYNGPVTVGQDNNNDSVQLKSDAQKSARALMLTNTAGSAVNVGQNLGSAYELIGFNGIFQKNDQFALNQPGESEQYIYNNPLGLIDITALQDNNNASVQLKDDAQKWVGFVMANTAGSAANVGQNFASAGNLLFGNLFVQKNYQTAINDALVFDPAQYVWNGGLVLGVDAFQNNNNGSTQIVDTQQGHYIAALNTAGSAANMAQNFAYGKNGALLDLAIQKNWQRAENNSAADQHVLNGYSILAASLFQNNNNGSVQIEEGAQDHIKAMVVANTASSAENIGQNIASLKSVVSLNLGEQVNRQKAESYTYMHQEIENVALLELNALQDNNNGSVQVNYSQDEPKGLTLSNVANSAVNIGQNIITIGDLVGLDVAEQKNEQRATAYTNSTQDISNLILSLSLAQDNNNASVQLNGSQNEAKGLSILNSAGSAVNVGQNFAGIFNAAGITLIKQVNEQKAFTGTETLVNGNGNSGLFLQPNQNSILVAPSVAEQNIESLVAVLQDNNNGSVQLNDSQNSVEALSLVNAAISAVNVGQNIASVKGLLPLGTIVEQKNVQLAVNNSYTDQDVANGLVLGQRNNNGSIQLNESQRYVEGLNVANVAGSAFNVGQNIASVKGITGLTGIVQTNYQAAINTGAVVMTPGIAH
ncbi:MAG: hypothetical protein A4E57_00215 [Syntrophorhabdaceae bacterium PtaU1.Bin034]|nr:MAG: hypothetical protein A4E57_00215 [Syntrophorhabdaceae bacterium PtaU1.Bin034]